MARSIPSSLIFESEVSIMFMHQISSFSGSVILSVSRAHLLELSAKHPEEHFSAPSLVWSKDAKRQPRWRNKRKARFACDWWNR